MTIRGCVEAGTAAFAADFLDRKAVIDRHVDIFTHPHTETVSLLVKPTVVSIDICHINIDIQVTVITQHTAAVDGTPFSFQSTSACTKSSKHK